MNTEDSKATHGQSFWQKLWKVPSKWYFLFIPAGGYLVFVFAIIFWGAFNVAMEMSSTEKFCISCHEMKDNVYQEYTSTIHYSNRTGVRAVCADCHVPKEFLPKVKRKIRATFHEIPHWLLGTINTPEKFEARRLQLATNVWKEMRANDSHECRNCHALPHMDLEKQARSARSKHTVERQQERSETCIDCHQGIAHKLAEGWEEIDWDAEIAGGGAD